MRTGSPNWKGVVPDVRGMLRRVARIEAARAPRRSTIEVWYRSLAAFEAETQSGIDAGMFDSRDMPLVLAAIRRWHRTRPCGDRITGNRHAVRGAMLGAGHSHPDEA